MASFHHEVKSGSKGTARNHAAYILRRGRYANRDDLIYAEHGNLPTWADNDPLKLFKGSDLYERANGSAYREHVIALPNELTPEQNCELMKEIMAVLAGVKPYVVALHASEGQLGGAPNMHMHGMYSDRVQDGIDRPPERMFSRYNREHPESGGCRKDSGGKNAMELRDALIATRKLIADKTNQALAKHGHTSRVDHRSLREQGQERAPERHLGPARVKSMSADEKALFNTQRGALRST